MTAAEALPFRSIFEQNVATLEITTDQPIVVVEYYDDGAVIAESGYNRGLSDDKKRFKLSCNSRQTTVVSNVPEEGVVYAGFEAIDLYVNALFDKTEEESEPLSAVIALTIINMFGEYFGEVPNKIYEEIAKDIVKDDNANTKLLMLSVIGAPNKLRSLVIRYLRDRAKNYKSLEDIKHDRQLMHMINALSEHLGIDELTALRYVTDCDVDELLHKL